MDRSMIIHPGEILQEEFLTPYGLTATRLAAKLSVPANRICAIVSGDRSITPETAMLLARAFDTSEEFWLNLQQRYDLDVAHAEVSQEKLQRAEALCRELHHA